MSINVSVILHITCLNLFIICMHHGITLRTYYFDSKIHMRLKIVQTKYNMYISLYTIYLRFSYAYKLFYKLCTDMIIDIKNSYITKISYYILLYKHVTLIKDLYKDMLFSGIFPIRFNFEHLMNIMLIDALGY